MDTVDWQRVMFAVMIASPAVYFGSVQMQRHDYPFSYYIFAALGILVVTGLVKFALIPARPRSYELTAKEQAVINMSTD